MGPNFFFPDLWFVAIRESRGEPVPSREGSRVLMTVPTRHIDLNAFAKVRKHAVSSPPRRAVPERRGIWRDGAACARPLCGVDW